ncbi:MAG: VOC family protein [Gammaproteobacteria bacterium]|nr:VOC family protein [Gammaproteobacteria bacterium]
MNSKIVWTDITVPNAEGLKDFYKEVVGWESEPVGMGDYDDFNMKSNGNEDPDAGICHARGSNSDIPPVWLVYLAVDDLVESLAACEKLGGKILKPATKNGKFAIIEDPAGAVCALYQVS